MYEDNPVSLAEAITEPPPDQLDGSQVDSAPGTNDLREYSVKFVNQLMSPLTYTYYFKEAFLTEQLLQALSIPDQKQISSITNDGHVPPLVSFPRASDLDSSVQDALSNIFHGSFRDIERTIDVTHDFEIYETAYCTMLDLIDELRKREIFHYLVPKKLEGEFCHLSRVQLALETRGDNITSTIALAAHWLHKCFTNHPECLRLTFSGSSWPELPDRVIDLTHYCLPPFSTESRVNVIETNAARGAYVALSYRWSPKIKKSSTLSRSTYEKLTRGIEACELMSEIQDACTLTKGLGIQYLWVDALCIVQGLGGDWHVQAEKMASVYMNAVVTIAAIDQTPLSVAAEERPFVSRQQELLNIDRESSQESIYLLLMKSGNFISRPFGELDKRGWVFQEQLLSSRIISLTKEGVFWDCLHHSASSNRPTGIQGDFSPNFQHSDTRKFKRLLLNPMTLVSREEYYWLWRRAVQSYTLRKLTRESDRFIALEGVTHRMELLLEDECILGIWRKDALRSLLWFVDSSTKKRGFKNREFWAPSWSWVFVNSPVQYRLWHPYERNVDRRGEIISPRAVVLELSAKRDNPIRFDKFSGRLTIVGALTDGYLYGSVVYLARRIADKQILDKIVTEGKESDLRTLKERYAGNNQDRYYIGDVLLDSDRARQHVYESLNDAESKVNPRSPQTSIRKIQCLLLIEGGYTDLLKAFYCLVLEAHESFSTYPQSNDSSGQYYRIGLCAFNTRHICVSSEKICTGGHRGYSDCMGRIRKVEIF